MEQYSNVMYSARLPTARIWVEEVGGGNVGPLHSTGEIDRFGILGRPLIIKSVILDKLLIVHYLLMTKSLIDHHRRGSEKLDLFHHVWKLRWLSSLEIRLDSFMSQKLRTRCAPRTSNSGRASFKDPTWFRCKPRLEINADFARWPLWSTGLAPATLVIRHERYVLEMVKQRKETITSRHRVYVGLIEYETKCNLQELREAAQRR